MTTPYLRAGSCVQGKTSGKVYVTLEATQPDSRTLRCVPLEAWSRHSLLCAWEKFWGQDVLFRKSFKTPIEDVIKERKGYEVWVRIAGVLPKDAVLFDLDAWPREENKVVSEREEK